MRSESFSAKIGPSLNKNHAKKAVRATSHATTRESSQRFVGVELLLLIIIIIIMIIIIQIIIIIIIIVIIIIIIKYDHKACRSDIGGRHTLASSCKELGQTCLDTGTPESPVERK